ncbi:MAG: hypothetical protein KKA16_06740 [Alphaproteobacteria bacterium]|nr:hypothetical protein [Alphaproteobacteria bacterium]MBU2377781.1 hypothetical protein [Alphaproteobacteria bacterium]
MRPILLAAVFALGLAAPALAQSPTPAPVATSASYAEDVASADAIVTALYASISGDAGVPRDWDRFRNLFHPSARLSPIGGPPEGPATVTVFTPDEYIARAEPFLLRGFHEVETADRVETFGHMTHVFSTYDSRHAASDAAPFARGINSIQLFDDGQRWWVLSVYWQAETPTIPLPAKYLPSS